MADIDVQRKEGGKRGIWPWLLGLLLLALILFGVSRCGRDKDEQAAPVAADSAGGNPSDTFQIRNNQAPGAAAAGAAGAMTDSASMGATGAMAGGTAGAAGDTLPVGGIVGGVDGYAGKSAMGTAMVADVVSDRGFWLQNVSGGPRLFAVLVEPQPAEHRVDIKTGQRLHVSGTVQRGGQSLQLPGGLEQKARDIASGQPVVLVVRPADVSAATP